MKSTISCSATTQILTLLSGLLATIPTSTNQIKLYNTTSGSLVRTLQNRSSGITVNSMSLLPSGFLVDGASDGSMNLWNYTSGQVAASLSAGYPVQFVQSLSNSDIVSSVTYAGSALFQFWSTSASNSSLNASSNSYAQNISFTGGT